MYTKCRERHYLISLLNVMWHHSYPPQILSLSPSNKLFPLLPTPLYRIVPVRTEIASQLFII